MLAATRRETLRGIPGLTTSRVPSADIGADDAAAAGGRGAQATRTRSVGPATQAQERPSLRPAAICPLSMTVFISPHTQPPSIAYYQLLADEPATGHVWKSWARTVSKASLPKITHRARDTQPEPCSQVSVPRAAAANKARPEQHRHNRPWFLPVLEAASLRSRCQRSPCLGRYLLGS